MARRGERDRDAQSSIGSVQPTFEYLVPVLQRIRLIVELGLRKGSDESLGVLKPQDTSDLQPPCRQSFDVFQAETAKRIHQDGRPIFKSREASLPAAPTARLFIQKSPGRVNRRSVPVERQGQYQ